MNNQYTEDGVKWVEGQEGFRSHAYWDVNNWRCGFGTGGADVGKDTIWTREYAEMRLKQYMNAKQADLNHVLKVQLLPNQFDMVLSLAYNTPPDFMQSTLIEDLNNGNVAGAADQFLCWVHSGGKVSANLVKRRKAEREIFLHGYPSVSSVPTPAPQTQPVGPAPVPVQEVCMGLKKWVPAIIGLLGVIGGIAEPTITKEVFKWASDNPAWASVLSGFVGAIYHGLPSPVQRKQ